MARKRIELNESDAAHVYEWLVGYWSDKQEDGSYKLIGGGWGTCLQCKTVAERLKKLIGRKEVKRIQALFGTK